MFWKSDGQEINKVIDYDIANFKDLAIEKNYLNYYKILNYYPLKVIIKLKIKYVKEKVNVIFDRTKINHDISLQNKILFKRYSEISEENTLQGLYTVFTKDINKIIKKI